MHPQLNILLMPLLATGSNSGLSAFSRTHWLRRGLNHQPTDWEMDVLTTDPQSPLNLNVIRTTAKLDRILQVPPEPRRAQTPAGPPSADTSRIWPFAAAKGPVGGGGLRFRVAAARWREGRHRRTRTRTTPLVAFGVFQQQKWLVLYATPRCRRLSSPSISLERITFHRSHSLECIRGNIVLKYKPICWQSTSCLLICSKYNNDEDA